VLTVIAKVFHTSTKDQLRLQDVLKRLRLIDDRVINALNTSLPTESFKEKKNSEEQCKQFCDEVYFT